MKSLFFKICSGTLIGGLILWLFLVSYFSNEYQWIYPLDDTYIHLSIAQNLWHFGNWSVVPSPFQFSSSSPLFSLILSITGPWLGFPSYLPLAINCVIGTGLFLWVAKSIFQFFTSPQIAFWVCAIYLVLLPFHLLVLLGMEHLLHVFLSLLFIQEVVPFLWEENRKEGIKWRVVLYFFLFSLCRYESLFLIGAGAGVFFLEKKYLKGVSLAFWGGIPLTILGIFVWSKGATFLPLSVLVKSQLIHLTNNVSSPISIFISEIYDNPFMLILALGLLILPPILSYSKANPPAVLFTKIKICLFAILFHMLGASIGGYRYEAYLIGIGLFLTIEGYTYLLKSGSWTINLRMWMGASLLLWSFPFLIRCLFFTTNFILSTQNIYQQQIQTARFLNTYYADDCIAANDIGAITYFNPISLLDFALIGDQKLYELFLQRDRNAELIGEVAQKRNVPIAAVYESFTYGLIPNEWIKVASWTIPNNFICADETVVFYAVSDSAKLHLKDQLVTFSRELPEVVTVRYFME